MIPLYEVHRVVKFIKRKSRMVGWGKVELGELRLNGCRISVLQNEKNYGDGWW